MYDRDVPRSTSSAGCATSIPPSGVIDSAMDDIEREITCLHEILHALESRLTPVIHSRPSGAESRPTAESSGVPLADRLRGFSVNIEEARSRIRVTIDSLAI